MDVEISGATSSRPLGKQQLNREEITARILAAAEEVFAEQGYFGASISKIAARAGIPKSNVVYYFDSKEALYRHVVREIFDIWRAAADALKPSDDPEISLGNYIELKMELARTRPLGSKVWANEIIQSAPVVQDYLEDELKSWTEDRIAVINNWITDGKMKPIDPRHLLYAIWAATQHYADFGHQITTLNGGEPLSDEQWAEATDNLKKILLSGVR